MSNRQYCRFRRFDTGCFQKCACNVPYIKMGLKISVSRDPRAWAVPSNREPMGGTPETGCIQKTTRRFFKNRYFFHLYSPRNHPKRYNIDSEKFTGLTTLRKHGVLSDEAQPHKTDSWLFFHRVSCIPKFISLFHI
jgi:hypothetical protein